MQDSPNHRSASRFAAGHGTPLAGEQAGAVTLIAGSRFLVCDPTGDVRPGGAFGYYAQDTRLLSRWELRLGGVAPVLVGCRREGEGDLQAISFCGDPTNADLVLARHLSLEKGLRQDVALLNLRGEPVTVILELRCEADFADLFEVKRGDEARTGFVGHGPEEGRLLFTYNGNGFFRTVSIVPWEDDDTEVLRDGIRWTVPLGPHSESSIGVSVEVEVTEAEVSGPRLRIGAEAPSGRSEPAPRLQTTDTRWQTAWQRSVGDVRALRLWDDVGDGPVGPPALAAGVPWFMTLFGRDSLISGLFALPIGPQYLLGALVALARRQGRQDDPRTAEQPGKILHEVRSGAAVQHPSGWGERYYGSVDATPLFVHALRSAWRWGADPATVRALLPAAERAVEWITGPGDPDGDGYVEYPASPMDDRSDSSSVAHDGLANQGWKDSFDAVRRADGTLAEGPIALVEVQGYCVAAFRALAELRDAFGAGDPGPLRDRADRLVEQIDSDFWVPELRCHAMALDGEKRPVDSVTSNPAHLLWCGAVPAERAETMAERLIQPDMFSGFGLRTLSSGNPGFNPMSYHCGSVWPHDSAIAAAGLYAYGHGAQAQQIAEGLLDASVAFGGRLPELYGGFPRERFDPAVPYPTSCSPQAWAACTPFRLSTAILGLDPHVPHKVVRMSPCLPAGLSLSIEGLDLGGTHVSVKAGSGECEISGLPAGVELILD